MQSIYDLEKDLNFEIILVDNHSSEISPLEFKKIFPQIVLIESPANVGFAKGNNLGITNAQGDYILLLNSDTLLKNRAVTLTKKFLENHPSVVAVSARLEFPNGAPQHNCQRFPSIKYKLFEFFRLQKLIPKKIGAKVLLGAFFKHDFVVFPDWIWGTFFMFRKAALKTLPQKKLSDDFFMYAEDLQWCMEFSKLGYKIAFEPKAVVIHFMGRSGGDKNELMSSNYKIFMRKYYSSTQRKIISLIDRLLLYKFSR